MITHLQNKFKKELPSTEFLKNKYNSTCLVICLFQSQQFQKWMIILHHHHHLVVPSAQISLTLSHHPSLSSIAPGKSSRLHPVSAQSCCISVLVGCPVFAHPCEGVHRNMSLMSSSILLQQCSACLVRLTRIVSMMGGKWPYSCCFVVYCLQDLFNIACSILVLLLSSFFSICFISVHVVHPYSSINTTTAWKKCVLFDRSGLASIWLIATHSFASHVLIILQWIKMWK